MAKYESKIKGESAIRVLRSLIHNMKCSSKPRRKRESVSVPLYPFDEQKDEKAMLSETELIQVSRCLAPRIRACGLVRTDVLYRFTAGDSEMNRLKRLVRRLLIDKRIFTPDEARKSTFFELLGPLVWHVEQDDDHVNSELTEGLRDIWQKAVGYKMQWQAQAWRLIELLKQPGEDVTQALLPHLLHEGSAWWKGLRGPTSSDSPWMCWVLGSVLERVFGVDDVLIPREAARELNHFSRFCIAIGEEVWWHCSLEKCRTYWSFVELDLLAHAPINKATESVADTTETDLAAAGRTGTPGRDEKKQNAGKVPSPEQTTTLRSFIETHCDISGTVDIESKVDLLYWYSKDQNHKAKNHIAVFGSVME